MVVFCSDLDNTLVYSYRHDIGNEKICVELYQGREVSFVTEKTLELLKRVKESILFVPTTTRTREQYERIDLGVGVPEYALVCNGGVLLEKGEENEAWYQESMRMIEESRLELEKAEELMEKDEARNFEVRNIRGLFLFTKSRIPEQSVTYLEQALDLSKVEVFRNGVKVYVVPKKLNKGEALRRLRSRLGAERIIAAGDSTFDIPMLEAADLGFAPEDLVPEIEEGKKIISVEKNYIFSEEVLYYVEKAFLLK